MADRFPVGHFRSRRTRSRHDGAICSIASQLRPICPSDQCTKFYDLDRVLKPTPPSITKKIALRLEGLYKRAHRTTARIFGFSRRPMTCEVYHAIRNDLGVSVKGRVLRIRKWREPQVSDGSLRNLWQMLKLWATPERPFVEVKITVGSEEKAVVSDAEGYFEALIPGSDSGRVILELPASSESSPVVWEPVVETTPAKCLVISDIDDTVLVTDAARTLRMIATTLFGNALTRQIFPGTAALYQGLLRGTDASNPLQNPFAYVTSSPFNLHGFLQLIFKSNGLPDGAYFMTDWGLDETKWLTLGHQQHKVQSIRTVLEWFPELPVILIGDSGQEDSNIYAEIAGDYPERVKEVMIRCVSDEERLNSVRSGWAERNLPIDLTIYKDSLEAAQHLHGKGWITEPVVEEVAKEFSTQPSKPSADQD